MAKQAKVVDFRRVPSPDPKRLGKKDRIYVMEMDDGIKLVVRVPDEDFTDDKLREAIKAEVQDRGTEMARTIEL